MRALVTGATGFIGSNLVETLIRQGYEVTCLVRRSSNLQWIAHLQTQVVRCDLRDTGTYANAVKETEYVFHVAGLTKAAAEEEFVRANAACTKDLIRTVAEINPGVRRFVFVSSLAAAGPSRNGVPLTEESPAVPVSAYGRSKLEGEKAALEYGDTVPVTIIRPAAVYGPRDRDFFLLFRAVNKGIVPYWGRSVYSLIFVDDLVRGIIAAAEAQEGAGKIFFLSDMVSYTNDDIVREMASALQVRAYKVRVPKAVMPVLAYLGQRIMKRGIINPDKIKELRYPNWTCDAGRARKELGFCPGISLQEGMQWTIDWYRTHKWL